MKLFLSRRVLTGLDLDCVDDAAILVDGNIIAWVGSHQDLDAQRADQADVVDLGDVTVMPGLVDCHVHLAFDAGADPIARMNASTDAELVTLMLRSARELLSVGVTSARDLGARAFLDATVRKAIATGDARGPRLLAAARPLTVTGGHCWFMGGEVDGVESARRMVRVHHKNGADWIKVMVTGGFITKGTSPAASQFELTELLAIVREAHRVGLRVAAHAHGVDGIRMAATTGVDTIEHCTFVGPDGGIDFDEDLLAAIAGSGAYVCPTINCHAADVEAVYHTRIADRLNALRGSAIPVVFGTDAGVRGVPHRNYVAGLEAMVHFGMSPTEVLVSATTLAARAMGIADVTGSLTAGLDADLVAVAGDPRHDIGCLHDLTMIMARGETYEPEFFGTAYESSVDQVDALARLGLQDFPAPRPAPAPE